MSNIATLITEISIIVSALVPFAVVLIYLINGIKCLLRNEMLRTYYHNKNNEQIRQYELENFVLLYKAYKALRGNSFIDRIYKEVMSFEVIT